MSKYTSAAECIESLAASWGNRESAIGVLIDGLRGGVVSGIGKPEKLSSGIARLQGNPVPKNPPVASIPQGFWESATAKDQVSWSWAAGVFRVERRDDDILSVGPLVRSYSQVKFNTADVVALCRRMHAPAASPAVPTSVIAKRGAPRKPGWNDWIAALALLASDGMVHGALTQTDLLRLVADRMAEAGLDEMPRATVQAAAERILEAFKREGVWA